MHVKEMGIKRETDKFQKKKTKNKMGWTVSARARITEFADPSDEREERVKDGSTHGRRLRI